MNGFFSSVPMKPKPVLASFGTDEKTRAVISIFAVRSPLLGIDICYSATFVRVRREPCASIEPIKSEIRKVLNLCLFERLCTSFLGRRILTKITGYGSLTLFKMACVRKAIFSYVYTKECTKISCPEVGGAIHVTWIQHSTSHDVLQLGIE